MKNINKNKQTAMKNLKNAQLTMNNVCVETRQLRDSSLILIKPSRLEGPQRATEV